MIPHFSSDDIDDTYNQYMRYLKRVLLFRTVIRFTIDNKEEGKTFLTLFMDDTSTIRFIIEDNNVIMYVPD